MKKIKVVIIGAGSASFGQGILTDLMISEELKEIDLNITLVDINEKALKRMYRFAGLLKEYHNSAVRIEATTDRKEALPGANYVITSVARERWKMWEKDFYIPISYGFRHIFGENGGPGAAFHTLRSLHLMIPIAKDMEKLCPDALLLNFTNPESRVCLGVSKLTNIRSVGLCHGPMATLEKISEILQKPQEEIDLTVGGINHFHWALKIQDKSTGEDLYPEIHKRLAESNYELDNLTRCLYDLFGLLTYPAASHTGEYVGFAFDVAGPVFLKWGLGQVSQRIGAKASERVYTVEGKPQQPSYHLVSEEKTREIHRIVEGKKPLTEEFAKPSGELAVPIICDIEFDRGRKELAVNVPNENFAVSNLPEDAIVEVPAIVNDEGVHPIKVGALPDAIAAICRTQISIQNLLVEAYRQKSKKLLLQALLLEPVVDSVTRAKAMMEEMLKIQAEYLPELK